MHQFKNEWRPDTSGVCWQDGVDIPLPPVSVMPTEILPVDANSPDSHVPRDPRLIRLTGSHPLNCEPPLTELFEAGMCMFMTEPMVGFLTPPELFYVRNHGAVPLVSQEEILTWEVSIAG